MKRQNTPVITMLAIALKLVGGSAVAQAQTLLVIPAGKTAPAESSELTAEDLKIIHDEIQAQNAGVTYLRQGDIPKAEATFRLMLKSNPSDSHAFYGLARCATAAGDAEAAISWFGKIVYSRGPEANDTMH